MMKKTIITSLAAALFLSGCAVKQNGRVGINTDVFNGQVLSCAGGALAGAVLANNSGDIKNSSNRGTWSVLLGLAGCSAGSAAYTTWAKPAQNATNHALNTAQDGNTIRWDDQGSNVYGTVTPTRSGYNDRGQRCRQFEAVTTIDNSPQVVRGTACKQPDGTWQSIG